MKPPILLLVGRSVARVHTKHKQFTTLRSSKVEIFRNLFFNILTFHNHQISCVKHPLFMCFSAYLGVWTGGKGLGHNVLMQLSALGSSKIEISETDFFLFYDHSQ